MEANHFEHLSKCATFLCEPILTLFVMSLKVGEFPNKWKIASLIPIFKKGSKENGENYRPISKLCALSNLFEKLMYKYVFATVNQLIIPQHGFYKDNSLESNLFSFSEYLHVNLDQQIQSDPIYTDFRKALHKINSTLLFRRLA